MAGVQVADPVISPDGRWVAWTASPAGERDQEVSELWLGPADGSGAPVRLTGDGAAAELPRWSVDSAWLFCVDGEEVHRRPVGADGAGAAETVLSWSGAISGLVPLAGGRLVAVVAGDERTDEDQERQDAGDDAMVWSQRAVRQHWRWHRLRLLDLDSGELTVAAGLAGRHVADVVQRPGGGPLAVLSWECPEFDPGSFTSRLHLADPADGSAVDLGPAGFEECSPAWWRGTDGWHVCWLAAPPTGCGAVVLDLAVPAAGDTAGKPADLTAGMTACPTDLVQTAAGPPVALFAEGLDTALYRLDPAGPAFQRVTGWPGRAGGLSVSGDAASITVLARTAYAPTDVWAGPPDSLARLSDSRPGLREVTWGAQERLSWQAPDGLSIDGVLILPPGRDRSDGPFPLVTMVHGGPYGRWADELMASSHSWGQWLAAAGFAVFHPNPRGSQGHGSVFASLVAGQVGADEWDDVMAGIDTLVADGVADPARLGIAGWSHGGFLAAWAVTQTRRFGAAIMGAGIVDWAMQVGAGEQGRAEADLSGGFGWEGPGPHRHARFSPISHAASVTTPVLMLHGENDTNVPVGQAGYFQRALAQHGVEHELVIYPREGHGIDERAHQLDVLDRARSWFTRWLGAPATG